MLPKSNLDKIKEISTEYISPDHSCAKGDLQLERAEREVGHLYRVQRGWKEMTSHGLEGQPGPIKHIDP